MPWRDRRKPVSLYLRSMLFHWLNQQPWFGACANLLQYVGSIGLISYVVHRYEHQCRAKRFCFRTGQIPVEGTSWLTCPRHSIQGTHDKMKDLHDEKHPERIGH